MVKMQTINNLKFECNVQNEIKLYASELTNRGYFSFTNLVSDLSKFTLKSGTIKHSEMTGSVTVNIIIHKYFSSLLLYYSLLCYDSIYF